MKALSLLVIGATGAMLMDKESERAQTLGAMFLSGSVFGLINAVSEGGAQ